MAEIKLTKEQQQVVDARNCSLLVAAAAGSGKTAVLVRRIIEKVMDPKRPADIDRLLIVTFTNAAAAEMRERIGAALEAALMEHPDSTHLQRQMMLLHNAQITTIHSFCLSVIREHFHLLELDPGFRIADEAELSLLQSDVLKELLEECYEKAEPGFLSFVECYGSAKSDKMIEDYVKRLYSYAMSQPFPARWLSFVSESFSGEKEEFKNHPLLAVILSEVKRSLHDALALQKEMLRLTGESDGPALYGECFIRDGELLAALCTAAERGYEAVYDALQEESFSRLSGKKQEVNEEKKERAKALRNTVKEIVAKLKKDFFYEPFEEMQEELHAMKEPVQALVELTLAFMERCRLAKEEKNLLDFSDLEQFALKVLVSEEDGKPLPTEAARALAKRYDEIMIDEYQDSNLVQEYILGSISGEWENRPNLFMVGDVKQSIYRFRMARPQLFTEKYKSYEEAGSHRKIDLHKNFRSRDSVLSSVNVLFAGLMHEAFTEVEYDAAAALYYGASYPEDTKENKTELLFVTNESADAEADMEDNGTADGTGAADTGYGENGTTDGMEEDVLERTSVQMEALAVAGRIKELLRNGMQVSSKEGMHTVRYEDIVILLRTMAGWSETFLEVLTEQGIPAYADTSAGYFRAMEVQKTLSFLKVLDNPRQDIPFAAVLHSPVAGLSAEELADIRIRFGTVSVEEKKQRTLYEAARLAADGSEKLTAFFSLYDRLRMESEYISIHELLEHFYEYSGYYDTVSVMPGGERRRGNLDMLVAKAKQYETTSYSGLHDFLRYMEKLVKYEVDFGEAKTEESGNMVRVMSIHKSKGLEFPVVFVCGMEKKFNKMDMRDKLIFHPELGIGADFVDTTLRVKGPTLFKKAMVRKLTQEMISEELRVLYVAMTRAKEKLILTGTVGNKERRFAAWKERAAAKSAEGLLSVHVLGASTYFDFICPLVLGGEFMETFSVREVAKEDLALTAGEREWTTKRLLYGLEQLSELPDKAGGDCKSFINLSSLLERWENYCYPFNKEAELPMKVTVSELKRLSLSEEEEEAANLSLAEQRSVVQSGMIPSDEEQSEPEEVPEDASYPQFLKPEQKISGSSRGTIYHRVLELLPFEKEYTKELLLETLSAFTASGRLSAEEVDVISPAKLLRFLNSQLAGRMRAAAQSGRLYKEQPFVFTIPAKEIYPDMATEETVLVQGITDAFFEEDGELVLLDYKTDYVVEDAKEELTGKYRTQLLYYKRALEQLAGLNVKEMRIYSFSADCEFLV